jgi:hypothetical protein
VDAAGAVDAQNAPTAPWKTTERFSTSVHRHQPLFEYGDGKAQSLFAELDLHNSRSRVALGEFSARRPAVTLIRTGGQELALAARAQDAARKLAHALWDRIGAHLRCAGRWCDPHAATM